MSLVQIAPLLANLSLPSQHVDGERASFASAHLRPVEQAAAIAGLIAHSPRPVLVVTSRQENADRLLAALSQLLLPEHGPLVWHSADPLPYEQLPHDSELSASRSSILHRLQTQSAPPPVVVSTVRAMLTKVRTPESFERDVMRLRRGDRIDVRRLVNGLVVSGYQTEHMVESPGTLSRRGGILDVRTPGADDAVRIDFFGDEIDSMRRFDPVTQRSTETVDEVTLLPPIEYDLSDLSGALARLQQLDVSGLRAEVADEWWRMLDLLEQGVAPASIDLLASMFDRNDATLLEYLPENALIVLIEPETHELYGEQIAASAEDIRASLELAGEIPKGLPQPYADWSTVRAGFASRDRWDLGLDPEAVTGEIVLPVSHHFGEPPLFAGNVGSLADYLVEQRQHDARVVIATDQSERVHDLLEERGIYPRVQKRGGSASDTLPAGTIDIVHAPLSAGFVLLDDESLVVLTDLEIFGLRKVDRRPAPQQRRKAVSLTTLKAGDYVVHVQHGVGMFSGLVTLENSGVSREYLHVEYAQGDRLYVPVDQADRLVPYESPGGTPRVTRLSSPEWSKIRARVRQAVREMAFELIQIYAAREMAIGHEFPLDSTWDMELTESFPFRETPDQLKAIEDVKGDMETPQPMDRLVCGDVGYGKTEVALRAAFKAVNDGMQVAVLVPTTILALQHYNSFRERLAAFPVRVEMLSRLRGKAEQQKITDGLKEGSVDIVIGTHRLLQRDVNFQNLGLLVVDEEQRFGVAHKEHIKRARTEVDVLTMTATPIPRTLHMALAGVRDLSLITTPPQDRVPIRTFVTPYSDQIVRESILREIARGGQVYVVHNRVQSIYALHDRLSKLVPEATLAVAHGQMQERELEQIVLAFMRHEFDVLICTTIIESGVDIPNANTMIIDNAQLLGLTQMYQLRGRVGRGTNRAYAYLLYPANTPLSQEAMQRLEAIQEATELGAGFQVALRDMEIRGAGNILGADQSGHMAAVGFDLYTRMLAHAVQEVKAGHPIAEPDELTLDIAVEATIPAEYIEHEQLRLEAYQRISGARNERELISLAAELEDRYGSIPDEVQRIIELVRLRHRATRLGILSIVERDEVITIRPVIGSRLDPRQLERALGRGVRVTPNQVRLQVPGLSVSRFAAIDGVLDAVAQHRAMVGENQMQESDSSSDGSDSSSNSIVSSPSSARISRARSA